MKRTIAVILIVIAAILGFALGRATGQEKGQDIVAAIDSSASDAAAVKTSFETKVPHEAEKDIILETPAEGASVAGAVNVTGRAKRLGPGGVTATLKNGAGKELARAAGVIEGAAEFGRFSVILAPPPGYAGPLLVDVRLSSTADKDAIVRGINIAAADVALSVADDSPVSVDVFFAKTTGGCGLVAPVKRIISSEGRIYQNAIIAMLVGLSDEERVSGMVSSFPSSAKLKAAAADGEGVVNVDFNAFSYDKSDLCAVKTLKNQVEMTLKQFPETRGVRITIGGESI